MSKHWGSKKGAVHIAKFSNGNGNAARALSRPIRCQPGWKKRAKRVLVGRGAAV